MFRSRKHDPPHRQQVGWVVSCLLAATLATTLAACSADDGLPVLDVLSDAEIERLVAQQTDQYAIEARAADPDVELPNVERLRFVNPLESAEIIASCLNEEGFIAAAEPGGGLSFSHPVEQQAAFSVAMYVCISKYPTDPKYLAPLNQSQYEYLYRYLVNELVPCLEAEGYELEAPSLQTYLTDAGTPREWVPFAELGSSPPGWLQHRCPQQPDGLYGELKDDG